ncbi:MAG: hypothetical protein A3H28_08430 [Acidobacteria bacterium RIFCSPLOWO2_02_FULL_61_28]|nr:MAG: hypothetical protein A3H28_08430 [Acidobacteria bacterium RIFCSPLOWO2_02_FULL_61_28]
MRRLSIATLAILSFSATLPAQLTERAAVRVAYELLQRAPDLPKAEIIVWQSPQTYMNAAADPQRHRIYFDATLVRFLSYDPMLLAFILAHEHGHLLASNCQASAVRLWSHLIAGAIAGALSQKGGGTRALGALSGMTNAQVRICEENADVAAVHFMREANLNPQAGIALFAKVMRLGEPINKAAAYFIANHPVGPERMARLALAIADKRIPDIVPLLGGNLPKRSQDTEPKPSIKNSRIDPTAPTASATPDTPTRIGRSQPELPAESAVLETPQNQSPDYSVQASPEQATTAAAPALNTTGGTGLGGQAASAQPKPLTNSGVLQMVKAGFRESVIIKAIEANHSAFDTSAQALIGLKDAGVSENVVVAMLSKEGSKRASPRVALDAVYQKSFETSHDENAIAANQPLRDSPTAATPEQLAGPFASEQATTSFADSPSLTISEGSVERLKGKGMVYIYRRSSLSDSVLNPTVLCDGFALARLEKGQFFAIELAERIHECWLEGSASSKKALKVVVSSATPMFLRYEKSYFGVAQLKAIDAASVKKDWEDLKPIENDAINDPRVGATLPW